MPFSCLSHPEHKWWRSYKEVFYVAHLESYRSQICTNVKLRCVLFGLLYLHVLAVWRCFMRISAAQVVSIQSCHHALLIKYIHLTFTLSSSKTVCLGFIIQSLSVRGWKLGSDMSHHQIRSGNFGKEKPVLKQVSPFLGQRQVSRK